MAGGKLAGLGEARYPSKTHEVDAVPARRERISTLPGENLLGESRAGVSRSHSGWAVRFGPGEGRKDQGAKLEERLSQSRQRPAVPGRPGPSPAGVTRQGSRPRQKRWSRGEPRPAVARPSEARLSTESDVRRSDGTSGGRREPAARAGGGKTQRRRGGDRRHDHGSTRIPLSTSRRENPGEARGGRLVAKPCAAGRDTEAERGQAAAGHPDGDGPAAAASVAASTDADL